MKTWLKKCGKLRYKHYGMMLCILLIIMTVLLVLSLYNLQRECVFWKTIATTPEPERCALCGDGDGTRYHAPAIVNLSTGAVGELQVYDNHREIEGELAEDQEMGVFRFGRCADLTIARAAGSHYCHTTLPGELESLAPGFFCHDCRGLLAEASDRGYVLLDIYDLENIRAFSIEDGAEYTIRDYTVSIYRNDKMAGLSIEVTGHLFGAE